jgi:hypothetical protein
MVWEPKEPCSRWGWLGERILIRGEWQEWRYVEWKKGLVRTFGSDSQLRCRGGVG